MPSEVQVFLAAAAAAVMKVAILTFHYQPLLIPLFLKGFSLFSFKKRGSGFLGGCGGEVGFLFSVTFSYPYLFSVHLYFLPNQIPIYLEEVLVVWEAVEQALTSSSPYVFQRNYQILRLGFFSWGCRI